MYTRIVEEAKDMRSQILTDSDKRVDAVLELHPRSRVTIRQNQ